MISIYPYAFHRLLHLTLDPPEVPEMADQAHHYFWPFYLVSKFQQKKNLRIPSKKIYFSF